MSDYCDKCEQRCLELSEYLLHEKEMDKLGDEAWSEYYCNRCLAERTGEVFTRTTGE